MSDDEVIIFRKRDDSNEVDLASWKQTQIELAYERERTRLINDFFKSHSDEPYPRMALNDFMEEKGFAK